MNALETCLINPKIRFLCQEGREKNPSFCYALDALPRLTLEQLKSLIKMQDIIPEENLGGCPNEETVLFEAKRILSKLSSGEDH